MGYALDLLDNKHEVKPSLISELYNPVIMGTLGVGMFSFANWMNRRPLLSGKKIFVNSSELCK